MRISDSSYKAAISFFEWINPSIEREVITWKKGMLIEINKIYKHVYSFHYPIAIWTDFENMEQAFLEALQKVTNYKIVNDELQLFSDDILKMTMKKTTSKQ